MKYDRTRKGLAVWVLALVALGTWLGAGMALNIGMRYAPAAASNGDEALDPATITVTPAERTVLPLGASGEENPSKVWTVRVEDANGVGVAGLLGGSFRKLYVSPESGSELRVLPILDAATAGRPGDYFVPLVAVTGAEPGSQHAAKVTVARPGFGALTAFINVRDREPGGNPWPRDRRRRQRRLGRSDKAARRTMRPAAQPAWRHTARTSPATRPPNGWAARLPEPGRPRRHGLGQGYLLSTRS